MDNLPGKIKRIDVLRIEHNSQTQCTCRNPNYELDPHNRFVYCAECGAVVDSFDALLKLAKDFDRINKNTEALLNQAKELADYKPHLRSLKSIEKHYQKHLYPLCPHCSRPIELEKINEYTQQLDFKRPVAFQGEWIQVDDTKWKCSCCETTFKIHAYPNCYTGYCPHCGAHLKPPDDE